MSNIFNTLQNIAKKQQHLQHAINTVLTTAQTNEDAVLTSIANSINLIGTPFTGEPIKRLYFDAHVDFNKVTKVLDELFADFGDETIPLIDYYHLNDAGYDDRYSCYIIRSQTLTGGFSYYICVYEDTETSRGTSDLLGLTAGILLPISKEVLQSDSSSAYYFNTYYHAGISMDDLQYNEDAFRALSFFISINNDFEVENSGLSFKPISELSSISTIEKESDVPGIKLGPIVDFTINGGLDIDYTISLLQQLEYYVVYEDTDPESNFMAQSISEEFNVTVRKLECCDLLFGSIVLEPSARELPIHSAVRVTTDSTDPNVPEVIYLLANPVIYAPFTRTFQSYHSYNKTETEFGFTRAVYDTSNDIMDTEIKIMHAPFTYEQSDPFGPILSVLFSVTRINEDFVDITSQILSFNGNPWQSKIYNITQENKLLFADDNGKKTEILIDKPTDLTEDSVLTRKIVASIDYTSAEYESNVTFKNEYDASSLMGYLLRLTDYGIYDENAFILPLVQFEDKQVVLMLATNSAEFGLIVCYSIEETNPETLYVYLQNDSARQAFSSFFENSGGVHIDENMLLIGWQLIEKYENMTIEVIPAEPPVFYLPNRAEMQILPTDTSGTMHDIAELPPILFKPVESSITEIKWDVASGSSGDISQDTVEIIEDRLSKANMLINFDSDIQSFNYIKGQSWLDWIYSEDNTADLKISNIGGELIVTTSYGYGLTYDYTGKSVHMEDLIDSSRSYSPYTPL